MTDLSDAGKEEVALALILWRDFKSQGRFEPEIVKQMLELARYLGVSAQLEALLSKVPRVRLPTLRRGLAHRRDRQISGPELFDVHTALMQIDDYRIMRRLYWPDDWETVDQNG